MSSQKRRGRGQRGGQSGRLQGEAVWGTLVGTLGQGRWEQKDPREEALCLAVPVQAGTGKRNLLFPE